jgi:hypothetical protein
MNADCATLQLTPAECAEWLAPMPMPDGMGWLLVAMALAAILGGLLALDSLEKDDDDA